MAKRIIIGGQKGGAGKSTITCFMANFITNNTDLSVLVIDADDMQESIYNRRKKELSALKASGEPTGTYYDIVPSLSKDIEEKLMQYEENYDIIFIDLPGNLKQEGALPSYALVDYLFLTFNLNDIELDSFKIFMQLYNQVDMKKERENKGRKTEINAFVSRIGINTARKREFYNNREEFSKASGVEVMETFIPYSEVTFGHRYSTIEDFNFDGDPKRYFNFYQEFMEILKK